MRRGLPYVDSNIFIYSVIYDEAFVPEAGKYKGFLLRVALGEVDAEGTSTGGER